MSCSRASWSHGTTRVAEAVWFTAPRRAEVRSEPVGVVGPVDVRIQMLASGVSAGSELLVYRGEAPVDLEPDLPTVAGGFDLPVKFGYATVGRVVETGADVAARTVDELVFVHHPHQTEYVVPADAVIPLPSKVTPEVGVFVANLETAVTVVLDSHVRLGETVLVTGQGVLGLLITMLLRRAGARRVITVDLHEHRRAASRSVGADLALGPDDEVPSVVAAETDGRGADVAIDVSSNPAGLQACIDSAAFSGTVVAASWFGSREVTLSLGRQFHRKRLRVLSSQVSTLDPVVSGRWSRDRRMGLVTELLDELTLSQLVTHRLPLADAASAYELLDRSPGDCLQVVLTGV